MGCAEKNSIEGLNSLFFVYHLSFKTVSGKWTSVVINSDRGHGGRLEELIIKCVCYYIYYIRIRINRVDLSPSLSVSHGIHTSANVQSHASARTHARTHMHVCMRARARVAPTHARELLYRSRAYLSASLFSSFCVWVGGGCVRACVREGVCVSDAK